MRVSRLAAAILAANHMTAHALRVGDGAVTPLPIPSGFSWTPPVNVYRSADGVYSTDFVADDWKVSASVDIWVSPAGNDTTGNGTQAFPYRGIRKALQVAAAGADVGYNIFVVAGSYLYTNGFFGEVCNRNINLIAVGGRVLASNKFTVTSWTLDGTGTYKATRSSVQDVRDNRYPETWPNGDQTPQLLTNVASVAACQAAASSWYSDGTTVWVHLQDGRVPDGDINGDVGVILGTNNLLLANARSWFVQGFDFEGASSSCARARAATGVTIPQFVMDDCTVRFQRNALARGIELDGVAVAITNNCRAYRCEGDAIGYSQRDASSPSCNAVEIGFHGRYCGRAATHTSVQNGSTNHAAGRTLRVNSVYRETYGPLVADIGSTQNWCLGVDAQNSLLTSNNSQDSCFQAGNPTGDTAKTWLDGCITGGSFYDLYAGAGCQILYKNMAAPASVGGSGTIGTY